MSQEQPSTPPDSPPPLPPAPPGLDNADLTPMFTGVINPSATAPSAPAAATLQTVGPQTWGPPQGLPQNPGNSMLRPGQRPMGVAGRRYGFLCSYCSSRLEAVESMAGQ